MKVLSMIMAASAVVLASSIYARPALLPHVKIGLSCLFEIVNSRNIPDSCNTVLTEHNFVQSAEVSDMTFDLRGANPEVSLRKAAIKLLGVPGITSLPIVRTKFDISIWDGTEMTSSFVSDWTGVTTNGFDVQMDVAPTALTINPEHSQAFTSLLVTLVKTTSHMITLRGHANVDIALSIPRLPILGALGFPIRLDIKTIPILGAAVSTDITLQGLNGFGGTGIGVLDSVSAIERVGANAGLVRFKIVLHNPASISIQMNDIKFQVWVPGSRTELLGIATFPNFSAVPGENFADILLEVDSVAKLSEYFPAKTGLVLTFSGYAGSSDNPIARDAMSAIEFNIEF